MKMFELFIGGVDGVTGFRMVSDHKPSLLKFLEEFDHEGSTVHLNIIETVEYPERVYAILEDK